MIGGKPLGKKFFIRTISLLFVFFFIFLIIDGYSNFSSHERIYVSAAKDMIDQRMRSLLFEMNVFPQYIGNNLLFLAKLSSLEGVLNSYNYDFVQQLEEDFLRFMQGSTSYYQLRYINENGSEVVRINYDGEEWEVVSSDRLQNKSHRYYFKDTMKLSERQIYLSELDLNIELGELENRGSESEPEYVPVLRIATPVFRENGERGGIVLLNIYTDYFLDDVRRSQRDSEQVFLINKQGYYLSHPDRDKEFAFMLDGNSNFFSDYPEMPREKVMELNGRTFEVEDSIFYFHRVHPTLGDVGLIKDSDVSVIPREDYYWILVSVSDKDVVYNTVGNLKNGYYSSLIFCGIIILIIIILIFSFVFGIPFFRGGKICD